MTPCVLEIRSLGKFSPIHTYGNAFGIMRMLHGDTLQVSASSFGVHQLCCSHAAAICEDLPRLSISTL